MSRYKAVVSYFGGKSKIADYYPEPEYQQLIEPFAGGAGYSLRHYAHDVWLNDLFDGTVQMWRFLTSPDALRIVRDRIPLEVAAGTPVADLLRPDDPPGLASIIRAEAGQADFGRKSSAHRRIISPFGAKCWVRLRPRLEWWIPRIAHWKITQLPYDQLPNERATWFVDPPYQCAAGEDYVHGAKAIDFTALGQWCRSRLGQVIVCEGPAAMWLPFRPLQMGQTHADAGPRARRGIYSDEITSTDGEMVYVQSEDASGLWADGGCGQCR